MTPELSDETRAVIRTAAEFAREYGSESVETEHLLLTLLTEPDGAVVEMLSFAGGTDAVRALEELQLRMGRPREFVPRGKIPLSPIAQQAVSSAAELAGRLNADAVFPSHLLLGLLQEQRGLASEVLVDLGCELRSLTDRLSPAAESHGGAAPQRINGSQEDLVESLIDFESLPTVRERSGDARVYVPRHDGWKAHIKRGWDKLYCYLKHPGDDAFHLVLNGEIYLQRGDEKYCLDCALRHGFATRNRLYWQRATRAASTE